MVHKGRNGFESAFLPAARPSHREARCLMSPEGKRGQTLMIDNPKSDAVRGYQEGRVGAPLRDAGWGIARKDPTHLKCELEWYSTGDSNTRCSRRIDI